MNVTRDNIVGIIEISILVVPLIISFCVWVFNKLSIMKQMYTMVHYISEQFKPNHGTSLFDRLKRIENRQISSHQKTQLLLSVHDDGIYECDASGKCIWVNKALEEIFGLSEEELFGNNWLLSISEKSRIIIWEYWQDCINKNIPYKTEYIIYNKKINKQLLVSTSAHPIINDDSSRIGYFGIVKIIKEVTNE